ncbi:ABC transporter permease [Olivibacter sp. SDN3]|uniref:ABC transporter permease n=1 Tax=Olivibacter sp. SDN3 TaxID=2764720 RepID=UPI0016510DB3|nr:ABC transporter permease [Olivibacter sp. SDN3]QNL47853.1 ABC transporter permease [Olivibacter sp. SDN3]
MIKNYFKIAWRNLVRAKGYAFINIFGLAFGMVGTMLILLWVQHELSFDKFYSKSERLYEAYLQLPFDGEIRSMNATTQPLAPALVDEISSVERATRFRAAGEFLWKVGDKSFRQKEVYVDPEFLSMFDVKLLQGDESTALADPRGVVISERFAEKLFGHQPAINKQVSLNDTLQVTIRGVYENMPANSRFRSVDALFSWSFYVANYGYDENWTNLWLQTFVEAKAGVSEQQLNHQIKDVVQRRIEGYNGIIFLHPAAKWHLWSRFENGVNTGGRIETVRMFSLIACFILLIACINFMNLSTARSEQRAKEVGIRKVSGAKKGILIGQFIGESILLACLSALIAMIIILGVLPTFSNLIGGPLHIPIKSSWFWVASIGFVLLTGLLAGSYPALFLSSFSPAKVLKGSFKVSSSAFSARKILVVLQFTFAITLIACTFIVRKQIQYTQNRDAGYQKDQLIYHDIEGDIGKNYELIRRELIDKGIALSMSKTFSPLSESWSTTWGVDWKGKAPGATINFNRYSVDANFAQTAGVRIVMGRDIDFRKFPTDSTAMLLNEAAVKAMGFTDPIGQLISDSGTQYHVIGVVEDFIIESPYNPVTPMIIEGPKQEAMVVHIRLNPQNRMTENLNAAEQIFNTYNPAYPFDYKFVAEEYASKFENEQRTAKLTGFFSGLTIVISCLGLFGLAAYTAEQRRKEIGVRKVLGASVEGVVRLLSGEFIRLVGIAFLIAAPIAWYIMYQWLQGFNYSISVPWQVFIVTGLLAGVIAILTVSFQAIKAAIANPVKSLRNE